MRMMSENIAERIYVALDLETTGLSADTDDIIEVGAVKFQNGQVIDVFQSLVNPRRQIPYNVQRLCNISQMEVDSAPVFTELARKLDSFLEDRPLVGHNISFDLNFLGRKGIGQNNSSCDTLDMAKLLLPGIPERSLSSVADYLGIHHSTAHRALADAEMSREIFVSLLNKLHELDPIVLNELARLIGRANWWLGNLIARVAEETGANILLGEASLEKVCFGSKKRKSAESLIPNEERTPLNIDSLAACFEADGPLARAFPGYEERPQQIAMMRAVAEALNEGNHLLVEAGTGTGKSMAYLLPAAFYALENNAPVVISTNTINLQEQLLHKDIPDLLGSFGSEQPISHIVTTQLKGRTNYLCPRRWETLRKSEGLSLEAIQFLARIQVWLPSTLTGDRSEVNIDFRENSFWQRICAQSYDCLGRQCPYQQKGLCFLHRARKMAESAHLIVINHALLLSEIATGSQILPAYSHLIIDEAHHLEEVATAQLGVEIRERDIFDHLEQIFHEVDGLRSGLVPQLQYLARSGDSAQMGELGKITDSLISGVNRAHNRVTEFFNELGALLQSLGEGQGEYDLNMRITRAVRAQPAWSDVEISCENLIGTWRDIGKSLHKVDAMVDDLPASESLRFELFTIVNIGEELRRQMDSLVFHPDESTVHWLTLGRKNNMITLHSAPLHAGAILEQFLYSQKDTLVFTGATLSTEGNFTYLKERLGIEDVEELCLSSPFDYEKAALVYLVPDVPGPGTLGYQEALGQALISLCRATQGRCLVLFTSHAALRATKVAIEGPLMEDDILVLGQGLDGTPRKLVASLKDNPRTVLLGAASFWEGVDIVGDTLVVLVIVRLPFNVPSDPVFAARSETFDNPFNEYALPQAAFKFKQGFGRLIRSRIDQGMLVVLDSRLCKKNYGRVFLDSLPKCRVEKGMARHLPKVVREWFGD